MAPPQSWALAHSCCEGLSKGSTLYLLCRACYPPGQPRLTSDDVESSRDPGKQFCGLIKYAWRCGKSPSLQVSQHTRRDMVLLILRPSPSPTTIHQASPRRVRQRRPQRRPQRRRRQQRRRSRPPLRSVPTIHSRGSANQSAKANNAALSLSRLPS